jgi:hypothetical protein
MIGIKAKGKGIEFPLDNVIWARKIELNGKNESRRHAGGAGDEFFKRIRSMAEGHMTGHSGGGSPVRAMVTSAGGNEGFTGWAVNDSGFTARGLGSICLQDAISTEKVLKMRD